ncbi:hypothetical protein Dimus_014866 [Dionaea muscipula]
MVYSSLHPRSLCPSLHVSASGEYLQTQIQPRRRRISSGFSHNNSQHSGSCSAAAAATKLRHKLLHKSLPFAVSLAFLLSSTPAKAGFLSGSSGIESVPGPQLPSIEFLRRFNEENQKKYAENDARIQSSPIMKELLERSKMNKEKNKQEIQDKYCLRGAEWGVGDCSAEGMTPDERDNFIAMLKKKTSTK